MSRVLSAKCDGRRAAGRPRWMYSNQEAEDLARGGLSRLDALDRDSWKRRMCQIGKLR